MFGAVFTFALQAFCAINENICVPLNPPPIIEPSTLYIESIREPKLLSETWNTQRLPIIETKYGLIEGYYMLTKRNRTITAFEGIRYALPPLGNLRFCPPVPITQKWIGIQSAKKIRHACLQMDGTQFYRIYGSEDCLFINIYTPKLEDRRKSLQNENENFIEEGFERPIEDEETTSDVKTEKLPVVVFIHGGGHFFGTSGLYGPSYLLDTQNVVLVTFNYRLGVLGYLSTGDSASPGNYALKDQTLALEWVQQNIDRFGGDPNKITLWGQSAGAVAVGLHLLSHKTRHIPIGGIMHSADAFSVWSIRNVTYNSTKTIASKFRCPLDDSFQLVSCLRKVNANNLVGMQLRIFKKLIFPLMTFGPVIEFDHPEAFLIESPEMSYERGNVSKAVVMKGHVPNEGDFFAAIAFLLHMFYAINRDYNGIMPVGLEFDTEEPNRVKEILYKVDSVYIPKQQALSFWNRGQISQMFGDRFFNYGVRKGLEYHAKTGITTYGFLFDYKGKYSSLESLGLRANDWGISHIDDLQFLLNSTLFFKSLKTTDKDFAMVEFMTNVWGNFITKQVPVYTSEDGSDIEFWSPIDQEESNPPNVIHLNNLMEKSKMIIYPYEEKYQLWKNLKLKDDINVQVKRIQ